MGRSFESKSKEELVAFLPVLNQRQNWSVLAIYANEILERWGDDYAVACLLHRAYVHMSRESAGILDQKVKELALAVYGNKVVLEKLERANELVARLDPR